MSSRNGDGFRETEAYLALLDADSAVNRYVIRAERVAEAGGDPTSDEKLRKLGIELHTHVVDAFRKQRPYVKRRLNGQYWSTTDIPELRRENGDGEKEGGLQLLDGWAMPVTSETIVEHQRHQGEVERTVARVNLLPFRVYQVTVDTLYETAERLGLLPRAEADERDSDPNPI